MSTFTENTGEAWIRNVNKRLAQLERLPHGVNATISAGDLTADTSVAFEAGVLQTSGESSDPSLGTEQGTVEQDGVPDVDFPDVDPYAIEDYDETTPDALTSLQYAPVTPSDPVIESRSSGIAVIWDGIGAGGEQMPVNMLLVETHRSVDPLFEPDESTYAGSFLDAGIIDFFDQTIDMPWYYRFVLVTNDGRRSTPSNAVEGTAHLIGSEEVGFSAIDIDYDGSIAASRPRTNYSTNPRLVPNSGQGFAEWTGVEWIEEQFDYALIGGTPSTSLYSDVVDGGAPDDTFTTIIDGGHP